MFISVSFTPQPFLSSAVAFPFFSPLFFFTFHSFFVSSAFSAMPLVYFLLSSPLLYSTFHCRSFTLLSVLYPLNSLYSLFFPSSLFYLPIFLSFPLFLFSPLSSIFFVSSHLYLSCGPNSPITAGRNYAWKLIRRSLNNYPLMHLIDFPFQELCFLSPGSAVLSPSYLSLFISLCLGLFWTNKDWICQG